MIESPLGTKESPLSPQSDKQKRKRMPSSGSPSQVPHEDQSAAAGASAFRNVSACNRCRVRKNRCDQRLPACTACEKAGTKCVSYDHITKREVPRSYVYYLETRVDYLESLLQENGIEFSSSDDFVYARPTAKSQNNLHGKTADTDPRGQPISSSGGPSQHASRDKESREQERVEGLVSSTSKIAVQGTSDARYLGTASGISFARVVFAAVKSALPHSGATSAHAKGNGSERGAMGRGPSTVSPSSVTMRDSFFGLHTKPTIKPAPFPSRDLGMRLVSLYFEHANPQIPVLHRPEFMAMFERVFANPEKEPTPRESFMLNIVFAIGAAIIVGKPTELEAHSGPDDDDVKSMGDPPPHKRRRIAEEQRQPEEYHASAIVHLESLLNGSGNSEGIGGSLEELQSVLLLAGFSLLRPIAPGLWYIIGVAVRLAVDLGLHADDGLDGDVTGVGKSKGANGNTARNVGSKANVGEFKDKGRKQYISDFRRRLWWCTYSLDRLVSSVVGRPFGISDRFITTQFPSVLDDEYITPAGITFPSEGLDGPSYKRVAYHYFRLRLLQSEILQTLQYRQTQLVRDRGITSENPYMLTDLPCPFLKAFDGSFRAWRSDMDSRLLIWRESAPSPEQAGVQFSPLFLELNYWQAVLMLYRQSLSVPEDLAEDAQLSDSVQSPLMVNIEDRQDADIIFMKVASAGQKVLKLYRLLHRKYLVNYTYLSTHHLFMAGISFLYAIWHSPLVRSNLTLDDVDFTALAATSVLDDLVVFCPPARACRDAFSKMTKTTIKMCLATTGFGTANRLDSTESGAMIDPQLQTYPAPSMSASGPGLQFSTSSMDPNNPNFPYAPAASNLQSRRPMFDTDLRGLFSEEESAGRTFSSQMSRLQPYQIGTQRLPNYTSQTISNDTTMTGQQGGDNSSADTASTFPTPFVPAASPNYPQQQGGMQNTNAPQSYLPVSPWSELDFLDSVSIPDNLNMSSNDPSIDALGLGFGWDGSVPGVDAGDGSGSIDIFDGFFFGGTGTGNGYGGGSGLDMSGM
ncbi:hypothetical protein BT63DRAFT_396167 [Microthyrium microscopicum]|uniref:Zn(2)-C6 fungal-type domain-containing protein n=1 Tax=Microthyrium microscopicum TaxID=703497 RepID=A0A6A6UVT2_9PEZI|nr:hypothetical protein BT63DRAFT_396167 [Microthyrium microscopicum]